MTYLQWMVFAIPPMFVYLLASYIILVVPTFANFFLKLSKQISVLFHGPLDFCSLVWKAFQRRSSFEKINWKEYSDNVWGFGRCFVSFLKVSDFQKIGTILYFNFSNIFRWGEKSVFVFFILLIGSWISRDPGFTPGWGDLLPHRNFISDSVSGVLISCILFVWPKDPFDPIDPMAPILKWTDMKSKFSWSCTLLIGAGYAISEGVDVSYL